MAQKASDHLETAEGFENFTNDSSMMIAYERALETERSSALFQDPFARKMAGTKGESLSAAFGQACEHFGFTGWPEFHKQWTAVRTRFIDDFVTANADTQAFAQLVNCGAGLDTRAYRLKQYASFPNGAFDVDMESVNAGKQAVFRDFLGAPAPHCPVRDISLDFLDAATGLEGALGAHGLTRRGRRSLYAKGSSCTLAWRVSSSSSRTCPRARPRGRSWSSTSSTRRRRRRGTRSTH
jgi:methyltransferase (TIGR00027 family)